MKYVDRFYEIARNRVNLPVTDCLRGERICMITLSEKKCREHIEQVCGLTDTFRDPGECTG